MAARRDGEQSLAHGVVVETRIVARLLRMPLLRLDGVIVLSPSQPAPDAPVVVVALSDSDSPISRAFSDGRTIGADLGEVARTLARLRNGASQPESLVPLGH